MPVAGCCAGCALTAFTGATARFGTLHPGGADSSTAREGCGFGSSVLGKNCVDVVPRQSRSRETRRCDGSGGDGSCRRYNERGLSRTGGGGGRAPGRESRFDEATFLRAAGA